VFLPVSGLVVLHTVTDPGSGRAVLRDVDEAIAGFQDRKHVYERTRAVGDDVGAKHCSMDRLDDQEWTTAALVECLPVVAVDIDPAPHGNPETPPDQLLDGIAGQPLGEGIRSRVRWWTRRPRAIPVHSYRSGRGLRLV
jgi:hypothetical protein